MPQFCPSGPSGSGGAPMVRPDRRSPRRLQPWLPPRRHPDRQIGDQPDRHGLACPRLSGDEALLGQPLQKGVEGDRLRPVGSEARHRFAVGIVELGRPILPARAAQHLVQRVEAGMGLQRLATLAAISGHRVVNAGPGRGEAVTEVAHPGRYGGLPVDQIA